MRLGLVLAALLLAGRAAGAEPDLARAKGLAAAGVRDFKAGDFAAALSEFQQADAAVPNPRLFYDIGLCQVRLGKPADAARSFDLFLQKAAADPRTPSKSLEGAHTELQKLAPDWVRLQVHASPPDAVLEVDGAKVGSGPVYVDRHRDHSIRLSASGYVPLERTVTPVATGAEELQFSLEPLPKPEAPKLVLTTPSAKPLPMPSPLPAVVAPPPERNHVPAYVAWGAAAALAIPTAYFGIHALSLRSDINNRGNQCSDAAAPGYDSACGSWHSSAQDADIFGGLAAAAAATGTVLWFVAPMRSGAQAGVAARF